MGPREYTSSKETLPACQLTVFPYAIPIRYRSLSHFSLMCVVGNWEVRRVSCSTKYMTQVHLVHSFRPQCRLVLFSPVAQVWTYPSDPKTNNQACSLCTCQGTHNVPLQHQVGTDANTPKRTC